jgi:hypothetical protein
MRAHDILEPLPPGPGLRGRTGDAVLPGVVVAWRLMRCTTEAELPLKFVGGTVEALNGYSATSTRTSTVAVLVLLPGTGSTSTSLTDAVLPVPAVPVLLLPVTSTTGTSTSTRECSTGSKPIGLKA